MSPPKSCVCAGVWLSGLLLCGLCLLLPGTVEAAGRTTMMNSVDAAFSYNPELKASQEHRQMARHDITRARAGYLPTVAGYAGGGFSQRSDATTRAFREQDDFRGIADAGIRLTQPIWHGGATMADVATRTAQFESSDKLLEDQGAAIAFDAIVAHTEVLRRTELVTLAEKNVKEHAQILNTVRRRYNDKVATVGELHQIESRHSRAKATLASYESSLDAAKANYLRVTGRTPGALDKTPTPKAAFPSLTAVRELCIKHNPRIQSAMADVRAAQGEKDQAKSRFYPQFDMLAGPSWSDRDSDASLRTTDFTGEVRVNWEFFSGGADKAAVDMTSAKIRQARQNLHALMNVLNEDIEGTFSRYESALVQERDYAAARKSSRLAREDYYRQFISAQRSLIDVLDAENDYFYAASQEVLCRTDRVIAAYRLLALSGTLLSELHLDPQLLRVDRPTTSETTEGNISFSFDSPLLKDRKGAPR